MSRLSVLGLLFGLAGCGGTFGAFDGLPASSDVSNVPWPRLVDTPEPPEERLTAGTGEQATERLNALRGQSEGRLARANQILPVTDSLLVRADANRSRPESTVPPVDEAGLLARAEQLQARTAVAPHAVDDADLLARAAQVQARSQVASSDVNETDLLARAALLRQRTAELGTVNEAELLARAIGNRPATRTLATPVAQSSPTAPRPPVPLRPLDTPVVSSSFEERARLARERAAGL